MSSVSVSHINKLFKELDEKRSRLAWLNHKNGGYVQAGSPDHAEAASLAGDIFHLQHLLKELQRKPFHV